MSNLPRFYTDQPLQLHQTFTFKDALAHHIHVRRLKIGTPLILFNGQGGQFEGTLITLEKRSATITLHTFAENNTELPYQVTLAQALASTEKMDWIIEKSIELGVHTFIPLISQKSIVRLSAERAQKKQVHWQNIILSACEQSGRNVIPQLHDVAHFTTWLDALPDQTHKIILSPRASESFDSLPSTPKPTIILIGPEGGFSSEEETQAKQHGFHAIHLGARILRTETAGIAMLSALASRWHGWGK